MSRAGGRKNPFPGCVLRPRRRQHRPESRKRKRSPPLAAARRRRQGGGHPGLGVWRKLVLAFEPSWRAAYMQPSGVSPGKGGKSNLSPPPGGRHIVPGRQSKEVPSSAGCALAEYGTDLGQARKQGGRPRLRPVSVGREAGRGQASPLRATMFRRRVWAQNLVRRASAKLQWPDRASGPAIFESATAGRLGCRRCARAVPA